MAVSEDSACPPERLAWVPVTEAGVNGVRTLSLVWPAHQLSNVGGKKYTELAIKVSLPKRREPLIKTCYS